MLRLITTVLDLLGALLLVAALAGIAHRLVGTEAALAAAGAGVLAVSWLTDRTHAPRRRGGDDA
ncbi:hypothetical protein [Cellulomonas uda]|uniref:Uncharacterized protein n=1 Tax=Cellulomonas uda TaxID=1714 RepID=A0A4Y3K7F2_CELUD|nr:hypothetical protein [Cellulomonas uda]NII67810.1 hypothetical protein [Cellulomonas uda]GEA79943.1 hypothetical protein CUD01_03870 [Cellulomonas uda]